MTLFKFIVKNLSSSEMSHVKFLKGLQCFRADSESIRMNCLRNCEYLLAYKLRRGQQALNMYKKFWGESSLYTMINCFKRRLGKKMTLKKKIMVFASSVALFDWSKNRIDEKYMRSHYLDLDYINYLTDLTVTCQICKKRLVIDTPNPGVEYCSCEGTKPVYNKKFGTCPWMPFLERQDLLIWRREQEHNPGMFEYKVYGFYKEVRADMFLQVQLDIEYRKQWDVTAVEINIIDAEPISNSHVLYWEMQWPKFFSNRDYVFNRRYIIDPVEKVIVITNHITEHPSAPVSPQKFRVKDYQCTMVIKPVTSFDQPGVKFCMTYFDNPGLTIPGPVQTWVATSAMPDFLTRLRAAATKYTGNGVEKQQLQPQVEPPPPPSQGGTCEGGFFKNFSIRHSVRDYLHKAVWINYFKSYFLTS